jgi:hypothetical protein
MKQRRKRIHKEKEHERIQSEYANPEFRNFSLWDPTDQTEQGRFDVKPGLGEIVVVAEKVATRVGGTKECPITIRLREWGTDFTRVYKVWRELTPFNASARPRWRKKGQTHYLKSHAKYIGTEWLDGSRKAKDQGIFNNYCERLQKKYERLKAEGKAEALDKEWTIWINTEIPAWFKPEALDHLFVENEERERVSVTKNLRMLRSYKSSRRKKDLAADQITKPTSDQESKPTQNLGKEAPNPDKEENKLVAGFIQGLVPTTGASASPDKKEAQP